MSALDADATQPTPLFRREALEHHANPEQNGRVLRLSPRWTPWCFWLVVAAVLTAVVYAALGTVHEYASGPAVVRIEDRIDVAAPAAGFVAKVEVRPGQHVDEGDVLVHLCAADESAELAHLEQEFELALVRFMRDRSDQAARSSLTSLRAQKDLAAARLDQRAVRAVRAGVVSDVHVRPGQHLAVGELILSIVGDDAPVTLIAVLPGQYRPALRVGMPLRFELEGYRYQYQELTIESVSDDVVGPAEVKRYLGPDVADTVPLSGPLVLVRARLPARTFVVDDQRYGFFDGLPGRADVRLRAIPIVMTLLPALRGLRNHGR
ncbi:MAG: efflux RND transporter periplasmic adaptor subunit [Polyangia bacterium]